MQCVYKKLFENLPDLEQQWQILNTKLNQEVKHNKVSQILNKSINSKDKNSC